MTDVGLRARAEQWLKYSKDFGDATEGKRLTYRPLAESLESLKE